MFAGLDIADKGVFLFVLRIGLRLELATVGLILPGQQQHFKNGATERWEYYWRGIEKKLLHLHCLLSTNA